MELVNFLILLLVCLLQTNLTSCEIKRHYGQDEPRCYSRFDYDYKIVQRLAELELDYSELKAVNDELLEQIGELKKKNSGTYINWLCRRHELQTFVLECQSQFYRWPLVHEPVHEMSDNMVCATGKASDQPAHTRTLIRAFASHLNIQLLLSY